MSTLSVVIPVYNRESLLPATLDSVLAQQRAVDEIIVVDDCSTDGSVEVARRYGITPISTGVNSGLSAARNLGLASTGCEYVALLDSDDIWMPEHTTAVMELLERHPECAVGFSRVQSFGDMNHEQEALVPAGRPVDAFWACARQGVVIPSASILKRSAALEVGAFDSTLRCAEDYDFFVRVARRHPFVSTPTPSVLYRKHGGQMSKSVLACRRVEYEIRARHLSAAREREEPTFVRRLEAVTREAWEMRLREAWTVRDPELMRFYLSLARLVPEPDAVAARWKSRARLLGVARAWDRLPLRVRSAVRRIASMVRPGR
jgi:glycosyltransferase involved in cell wall biosynthesis